MFPRNKIAHLNKMQYIYYICFPALKSHSLRKQLENKSVWRKPWCWPSLAVGPDPARHAHSSTGRQLNLYVGSLRKMTRKRETNFTWTLTSFRHYLRECCSFSLLPTLPSQSCCPYSSKGDLKSWPHKLDQRKHVSRWVDWASCWLSYPRSTTWHWPTSPALSSLHASKDTANQSANHITANTRKTAYKTSERATVSIAYNHFSSIHVLLSFKKDMIHSPASASALQLKRTLHCEHLSGTGTVQKSVQCSECRHTYKHLAKQQTVPIPLAKYSRHKWRSFSQEIKIISDKL